MLKRLKMVATMESWLGAKQGSDKHREIIDIYNSITPLPRGYKMKYTDAWCAATVSACAKVCDCLDVVPAECGCGKMINKLKELGEWEENDAYVPNPGDLIFYDWDDDGKGDNTGAPYHVGLVLYVRDGKITVGEGNKGDAHICAERIIPINGRYIRGFGVPKYDDEEVEDVPGTETHATEEPKDSQVVYYTVVKGDTLLKIAEKYGTTVVQIVGLNNFIANPNKIYPGWVLKIPATIIPKKEFKNGDVVHIKEGSTWVNGKGIPKWCFATTMYYRGTNSKGAIISRLKIGPVTGVIDPNNLI